MEDLVSLTFFLFCLLTFLYVCISCPSHLLSLFLVPPQKHIILLRFFPPFSYLHLYLLSLSPSPQCDQEHCIQSTKFLLQAAATPLLHSNPVMMGGEGPTLPGKSSLGGPCASLAPSQPSLPSSMPGLGCAGDMLTLRDPDTHCHHHHFVSPEETPSPGPMPLTLPCPAHMTHGGHMNPAQLYDPASQDSLHEDSVRGLVKLSSV